MKKRVIAQVGLTVLLSVLIFASCEDEYQDMDTSIEKEKIIEPDVL